MARKSVTIRDVARHAGVSVATASRALNGKDVVNPQTRDRILSVMEELGFSPSPAARRLSLGRTLTIGVVVSFLTRPQAAERLRGVDAVLTDSEFDLVIYNVESVEKRDHYLGTLAQSQRTDGLIVMSLPPPDTAVPAPEPRAGAGRLHRRPYALHRGLPRVIGDDAAGGALAARHLLELGHRRSVSSAMPSRTRSASRPVAIASRTDRRAGARRGLDPGRTGSVTARTDDTRLASWLGRCCPATDDRPRSSRRAIPRRWASSPRRARSGSTFPTTSRSSATTTSRRPTTSA